MNMGSRASTPEGLEGYRLSINGRRITPGRVNELELGEENRIILLPLKGGSVKASLYIDGVEVIDRGRPYENPEAVEWRWRPDDPMGIHRLTLKIEGGDEYLFEIYGRRRIRIEMEHYLKELRRFSLNLIYQRYGHEMRERLQSWFNYISEHWSRLEPVVERISREPQRRVYRERVERPIGEVDRIDAEMVKTLLQRIAERGVGESDAEKLRELIGRLADRVIIEEERVDHDTVGNRLLRYHLDSLLSKLEELKRCCEDLDEVLRGRLREAEGDETVQAAREFLSNHDLKEEVERLRRRIQGRLRDPRLSFLMEIKGEMKGGELEGVEILPHYAELYKLYRNYSEKAPRPLLGVDMPILRGRPDEIYRRWCAVKLLEAVQDLGYKLEEERIITLNEEGIKASMNTGLYSKLNGEGCRVNLYYGRRYGDGEAYGSYTSTKWVSLCLEAFTEGEEKPRIIVFEPRFDLDYSEEKFERDVDTLHILRDAIVDHSTGERLVSGGAILHPADLEPIRFRELSAIPLRPGRVGGLTALLSEFLT